VLGNQKSCADRGDPRPYGFGCDLAALNTGSQDVQHEFPPRRDETSVDLIHQFAVSGAVGRPGGVQPIQAVLKADRMVAGIGVISSRGWQSCAH
jgi:hypothetical protein